jgi:hypothetical protein
MRDLSISEETLLPQFTGTVFQKNKTSLQADGREK